MLNFLSHFSSSFLQLLVNFIVIEHGGKHYRKHKGNEFLLVFISFFFSLSKSSNQTERNEIQSREILAQALKRWFDLLPLYGSQSCKPRKIAKIESIYSDNVTCDNTVLVTKFGECIEYSNRNSNRYTTTTVIYFEGSITDSKL